jgi:cation diffusion facilitator family transporter
MPDRVKRIKAASWVGIGGNAFLALFKIFAGTFSGSLSVVADGIDSSGDVFISVMTLYIAYLLSKPPNLRFPYGYGKAEPNATKALSFIIFFAGAQLAISSIRKLASGNISAIPGKLAIIAVVISIIGKLLLAWYQLYIARKTKSSMLYANAKNMQGDVIISSSVLLGLIFIHVFRLPILDTITAILVSGWIMWVAIRIFIETNLELMDGNVEKTVYKKVFEIVEAVKGVKNPHRMRIRRIGHKLMVNIDIELDGDMTLHDAHQVSHIVEREIKTGLDQDVLDVIIHIEPYGDETEEQRLGVSKEVL